MVQPLLVRASKEFSASSHTFVFSHEVEVGRSEEPAELTYKDAGRQGESHTVRAFAIQPGYALKILRVKLKSVSVPTIRIMDGKKTILSFTTFPGIEGERATDLPEREPLVVATDELSILVSAKDRGAVAEGLIVANLVEVD
jgi:hypothetical protein